MIDALSDMSQVRGASTSAMHEFTDLSQTKVAGVLMMRRYPAMLLIIAALVTSCNFSRNQSAPAGRDVITTEEVRLWSIGQAKLAIRDRSRYYIVGKISHIGSAADGSPSISFGGVTATFPRNFARARMEALVSGRYVVVDCEVAKHRTNMQALLQQCVRVQKIRAISANGYETAYARSERSARNADNIFASRYFIVLGRIYEKGRGYIYLETRYWGEDDYLVAGISRDNLQLSHEYYNLGDRAVMLCRGGQRQPGQMKPDLSECRVLGKGV